MRDIILLGILPLLVYAALRKPFLSVSLWVWSGLVPPYTWVYGGLATSVRWNFLFAVLTIVSFMIHRGKNILPRSPIFVFVILFLIHGLISSFLNNGDGPIVWYRFNYFWRTILLFVFIAFIARKKIHFEAICWGVTLSFATVAMLDGMKFVASFGGHNIFGLTPAFNDNNLSALASLMCVPLVLFLAREYKDKRLLSLGLFGLMFFNVMFILGSNSRGAFLGLAIFVLFYWLKSQHKFRDGFLFSMIAGGALAILSDDWFNRMESISDAGEDDSFQGRVRSWKLAILMAMRHPFFGGGFDATFTNRNTAYSFVSEWDKVSFIPSPVFQVGDPVFVAHSIYFQVLADTGFVGLFWYGIIALSALLACGYIIKNATEAWQSNAAEMLRLSLLVFYASGAALSSAYNDLYFSVLGCVVALYTVVKKPKLLPGQTPPRSP